MRLSDDPDRLSVHHVGGRFSNIGGQGFPLELTPPFFKDCDIYLYEADADAIEQIYNVNRHLDLKMHVFNVAVAAKSGKIKFNIGHDRYGSSLLAQNERYRTLYSMTNAFGDFTTWDSGRTIEEIEIDATSIDDLAKSEGIPFDFLSTDAEGADFDLLRGAREMLKENCVGFYCEAQLIEYRKGSHHLGHILDFANSLGYRILRYDNHGDLSYYRGPIGWRGKSSNVFGDALFLKEIDDVVQNRRSPARQLRKLAFVAFCFGQIEYAVACIEALEQVRDGAVVEESDRPTYVTFIERVAEAYKATPKLFPTRYVDCFSPEETKAFNRPDRLDIVQSPSIAATRTRHFAHTDKHTFLASAMQLLVPEATPFEKLLVEYRFNSLAQLVAERRVRTTMLTLQTLGLVTVKDGQLSLDQEQIHACLG